MNDSRRLGRLFGIDVYRRWPFLIVPIWVAVTLFAAGAALASAVNAALFILAALACVSVLLVGWFVFSAGGDEAEQNVAAGGSTGNSRPSPARRLPARSCPRR